MLIMELLLRRLTTVQHLPSVCSNSYEQYFEWQYQSTEKLLTSFPQLDMVGRSVLDIGCGVGGRTAYIATQSTDRTVGIDINADEISLARQLCRHLRPEVAGRVEFLVSQENGLLPIGTFDNVLLIDSMEHVVSPPKILRLAYQYTKLGGRCYIGTLGWYHHAASHTGLMPWVQVLFSDETILNVIRWRVSRPDYIRTHFDSDPPIERWRDVYSLRDRPGEHLNKITVRELQRLTHHTVFREATLHILPFRRRGVIGQAAKLAARIPILQELLHSYVVIELVK